MGVVKPNWVTKKEFERMTFNYCDHFGNQEYLATRCKVCKQELQRYKKYKELGQDPYDIDNVIGDVANNLKKASILLDKKMKELGITPQDIGNEEVLDINHDNHYLYKKTLLYSKFVEKVIDNLQTVPVGMDLELLDKAKEAYLHSLFYIIAKISRALDGKVENEQHFEKYIEIDVKNSALLAYIAVKRNNLLTKKLISHKHLKNEQIQLKNFLKHGETLLVEIQKEFFRGKTPKYVEYGYKV